MNTQQSSLAYFIYSNIQHLPPVLQLFPILGGTVITTNQSVKELLEGKYAHLSIPFIFCKSVKEARKIAKHKQFRVIVYTSFHHLYCGKAVQIFHGGLSDKRYLESARLITYDLVLFPGQKSVDKVRLAGTLPFIKRWALVGYPKFDNFIKCQVEPPLTFENQRKTILYAPTWVSEVTSMKQGERSAHGESSLLRWSMDIIRELAGNYNLILKYHSNLLSSKLDVYQQIESLIQELNCEATVKPVVDDNIMPYMFISDLMISDISSVCYEWLHTGKPIIFANPAPGKYSVGKTITDNTYVWQAGRVINESSDIARFVNDAITKDEFAELRQSIFNYAIYQPDGNASDRQAQRISELIQANINKQWQLFYWENYLHKKLKRSLANILRFVMNIPR